VSPVAVLLVLLVLAYVGGVWARARHSRSFGSASGVEYAVLGVLLGPHVLGAVGRGVQSSFEPLALVALSWIALGYGLDCGLVGRGRARVAPMLLGVVFTALVMAGVGGVVYVLGSALPAAVRLPTALAVGLVSAESTRYGVRRVGERHGAAGPLYRFLNELAAADDAPALLALPLLYALAGAASLGQLSPRDVGLLAGGSLLCAGTMGVIAGWLIARTSSPVERWTLLLGCTWLTAGAVELVGASAMGACFALGVGVSATCPEASVVRRAVARTEGPVLLPALVLAGARLAPLSAPDLLLLGVAIAARIAANFAIGAGLSAARVGGGPAVPGWLGLAMQSSGTLSMVVGFGIALKLPGSDGNSVLACAILGTLLGELLGPAALRRALAAAGELGQMEAAAPEPSP
jgi:hypothetical protein